MKLNTWNILVPIVVSLGLTALPTQAGVVLGGVQEVNVGENGRFTLPVHFVAQTQSEYHTKGLTLRVHYNSSAFSSFVIEQIYKSKTSFVLGVTKPQKDVDDKDGNPSTDTYIQLAWADFSSKFPGQADTKLLHINGVKKSDVNSTAEIGYSVEAPVNSEQASPALIRTLISIN